MFVIITYKYNMSNEGVGEKRFVLPKTKMKMMTVDNIDEDGTYEHEFGMIFCSLCLVLYHFSQNYLCEYNFKECYLKNHFVNTWFD